MPKKCLENCNMDSKKKSPAASEKKDIKIKENPKAAALRKAPDEVLAKAIHEALFKDKEKK